jgi:hypothetical protein
MGIIALISLVLRALCDYLELRKVSASYDLRCRIESDIETDENKIKVLRALGTSESNSAADLVRNRIVRSLGIIAALPATVTPVESGSTSPNGAGDIHPAGK